MGAGPVGRRRVAALHTAGARVRWVAPDVGAAEAPPEVEAVAAAFAPHHLDGVLVALACAPAAVNDEVVEAARARGVLVGRSDVPEAGDLVVPAVIRRGPLLIDVGTGGAAPAASGALRRALEPLVPASWGRFVELLAEARRRLPTAGRAERLKALARGPLLAMLGRDEEAARRLVETAIAEAADGN